MLHSKTVSLEGGALNVQLLGKVHKYPEYLKCQRLGADAKNTKIRAKTSQVSLPAPPSPAPSDDGPSVGAEAGSDPDDDSERRQPPLNSSWGPAPPPAPPPPADDAAPPPAPPPPAGAVVAPPPLLSHIAEGEEPQQHEQQGAYGRLVVQQPAVRSPPGTSHVRPPVELPILQPVGSVTPSALAAVDCLHLHQFHRRHKPGVPSMPRRHASHRAHHCCDMGPVRRGPQSLGALFNLEPKWLLRPLR